MSPLKGRPLRCCAHALCIFLLVIGTVAGHAQIATQNNPHGKIKNACGDCHTTKSWSPLRLDIKFKHENTGFALEGRHALTPCKECHASLLFTGASRNCKSCHIDAHDGTLGVNCARCHTFQSWQDVSLVTALHQTTRFALHGRHQHVGCDDCHRVQNESQYVNMPLNCYPCHQKDYDKTTDPNHVLSGFPMNCEQCHMSTVETWKSATFLHPSTFPLKLGHAGVACEQCHARQFRGTSRDCFSCHQGDFQDAKQPSHVQAQFSHDCTGCHTTADWQPATFDHSRSRFPLSGAHQTTTCEACHRNGQFTGTPTDCYVCHQSDFTQVTDPNHAAGNFSHGCLTCHTTSAWEPSTFNHNNTAFPLLGAHQPLTCEKCHANGVFAGTPKDCYSCHQSDFARVTDPNHVAGNFSHDCTACHTMNAWMPATFDHDVQYFPIYSGPHRGKWQNCSTCHVVANNYKVFECINCHAHEQLKMNDKHRNVRNYQYNSTACYNCHPNGKE